MLLEDGVDQGVLGREAPVQGSHPDARSTRDLFDARVDAELRERSARRFQDAFTVLLRVAA